MSVYACVCILVCMCGAYVCKRRNSANCGYVYGGNEESSIFSIYNSYCCALIFYFACTHEHTHA